MDQIIAPIPNLTYLIRCLFRFIANHPLIINPIITHPITDEPVPISVYRLYDGLEVRDGLTCSIFAHTPSTTSIPSPTTKNIAVYYEPYDMGKDGLDKAIFHIVIKFSINAVVLGNIETDENVISVPAWSRFGLGQNLLTSNAKKNVILEINPGVEIIQDYLHLIKYVIDDIIHLNEFPIQVNSFQMLWHNVKSQPWEDDENIYFQEGIAMTLFEAYINRGWRDSIHPLFRKTIPSVHSTIN